ncbi:O-antigen ligase family protein [Thalassospira lucentensis]|uniref:O-antigen ligase family protein n=1 Tax=Thalassospira lucentensis TaxID=168935 RepID=UPI00294271B0|nr:O-antigen ligase family protein [Thalassospira lucentensis]WOI11253.1 O-antigen ligase family protein [Thalassospira lucentensis]
MNFVRRFVFYGLLALIAIAPLPFGSNRPWAWSILSLWVGILVLLDAIAAFADPVRGESRFMKRIAIPAVLFISVVIWIVIQASPDILPAAAHPMWGEAAAQLGRDMAAYVSIDPERTRDALMVLLAYAGVFWLAARHGRDRANAAIMLKFFVIVSTVYAIYGLAVFFGGWEKILWYDKSAYIGDLTSTFINHNHYATYAGIGLVSSLLLLLDQHKRYSQRNKGGRARAIQNFAQIIDKNLAPFLGVLLNSSALILTHSRGGVAATGMAIFIIFGLFLIKVGRTQRVLLGASFAMLTVVAFNFLLSGEKLLQRIIGYQDAWDLRKSLYGRVVEAISGAWLEGYGAGTFKTVFHAFKDSPELSRYTWQSSHNLFLDLFVSIGFVFGLMSLLVVAFVFFDLVKGALIRSKSSVYSILGVAILLLLSLHSLIDFSLKMYSVSVSSLYLIGLVWAVSVSNMGHRRDNKC